ncbi:MAG: hypothetical protein WC100_03410 [Sterolibacterium sp.]
MPTYHYACKCGEKFNRVLPVVSCRKKVRCPGCSRAAARDFIAEHANTVHVPANWPMCSDAAGVHPKQINEASAHAERIGIPTQFNSLGQAVFNSPQHRKKYCEHFKLFDKNGGFSDPQPR